eukprot:CAMPEP_0180421858 /NCGR_PEP_ID=MMETSP1036_2-20121128/3371_1 /TAXON_ID=632150 /ORGANISM="Azadinium spinosum, Strain 3D9" /LENGTH=346 /DNA_ID=CAMNT_0022427143 /DNA_START=38 /DNA_END=1075 /DNA_ORIENTATION=-
MSFHGEKQLEPQPGVKASVEDGITPGGESVREVYDEALVREDENVIQATPPWEVLQGVHKMCEERVCLVRPAVLLGVILDDLGVVVVAWQQRQAFVEIGWCEVKVASSVVGNQKEVRFLRILSAASRGGEIAVYHDFDAPLARRAEDGPGGVLAGIIDEDLQARLHWNRPVHALSLVIPLEHGLRLKEHLLSATESFLELCSRHCIQEDADDAEIAIHSPEVTNVLALHPLKEVIEGVVPLNMRGVESRSSRMCQFFPQPLTDSQTCACNVKSEPLQQLSTSAQDGLPRPLRSRSAMSISPASSIGMVTSCASEERKRVHVQRERRRIGRKAAPQGDLPMAAARAP